MSHQSIYIKIKSYEKATLHSRNSSFQSLQHCRVRGSGIQYPSGIQRRKTTEERGFRIHDRPGNLSGISRMAARSRTQGARQRRHGALAHVHDGQPTDENFQPVTTLRPDSDTTQPRLRLTQDEKTTPCLGVVFSNRKDDRFRSLQIDPDVSADLLQRYFAELGIVLRREDALLGVEQALLRLAHLDAGQIAQQVTLHGDLVVLAGGDQILGFELDHFEVVAVGLPEIRQIRHERRLQLLTGQFGVFDRDPSVALLAAAVVFAKMHAKKLGEDREPGRNGAGSGRMTIKQLVFCYII